jgi:putative transposon-encoded protein
MVDERGRDKNQICNGGRRAENEMWDNYRFILPARESHFRSVSKTVSIPKDLGHQRDWRGCHNRHIILDSLRMFHRKILDCASLPILTDSSQRSFSRFQSLFLQNSEDGPHTLLNGGLRRIPITLVWNCCRDLLNLCFQHLVEAQLVLCSDYEVVYHTPFQDSGNEASIRVPKMFISHVQQQ